jgi:hypothetical protein
MWLSWELLQIHSHQSRLHESIVLLEYHSPTVFPDSSQGKRVIMSGFGKASANG